MSARDQIREILVEAGWTIADDLLDAYAHELAEQMRQFHDKQRPYYHMGQRCKPEYQCGVAQLINSIDPEVDRLLDCGLCYEENGEEIHPHPECTES